MSSYALPLALLFQSFVLVALLGFLIWSLNRGLDTLDEGSYFLLYARPADYFFYSPWYHIVAKLPHLTASEVINYRLLNLLSRFAAGSVLATGVYAWLKQHFKWIDYRVAACLFLVAVVTNIATGAMMPPAISYNSLTSFLLFCATGVLFFDLSLTNEHRAAKISALVLAGFCCGLCFFVKPTSCIAFLFSTPLLFAGKSRRRELFVIAFLALGILISVASYFSLFDNIDRWYLETKLAIGSELVDRTHLKSKVFERSATVLMKQIGRLLIILAPLITAIATKGKYPRISKLSLLLVCGSVYYAIRSAYYLKFDAFYAIAIGAITVLMFQLRENSDLAGDGSKSQYVRGLIFLAAVPFSASCGTNNVIMFHAVSNICPLMLMAALCMLVWSPAKRVPALAITSVLIATINAITFVRTFVISPYRLPESMLQQNAAVVPGTKLSGILLDRETKQMVDEVKELLDKGGFREGDPILAFYDIPGVVYAVGGRSIGIPWFSAYTPDMDWKGLNHLNIAGYPRLFMLATGAQVPALSGTQNQNQSLDKLDPNVYVRLGVAHGPLAQVKPRRDTIYVYRIECNSI